MNQSQNAIEGWVCRIVRTLFKDFIGARQDVFLTLSAQFNMAWEGSPFSVFLHLPSTKIVHNWFTIKGVHHGYHERDHTFPSTSHCPLGQLSVQSTNLSPTRLARCSFAIKWFTACLAFPTLGPVRLCILYCSVCSCLRMDNSIHVITESPAVHATCGVGCS